MTSQAVHQYPATSDLARWLAAGFISGALAVLIFHQGALALLHSLNLAKSAPYSMHAAAPWGVPQIWSLAF